MSASQRLFLKIHKAIAEQAGSDLVGYSVFRALRIDAMQITSLMKTSHDVHAETFARMHAEPKTIAATRQMFLQALAHRENLRDDYYVGVTLKTRGVTEAPVVVEIIMWDIDAKKKAKFKL
jgi:hypothetical protein